MTAAPEVEAAKDTAPTESPAETPAATTKDKRRTSFFGNFGKKKGDSDNEEGEAKPKNKLGGLFRKPSKAVKSEPKAEEESKPAEPKTETVPEAAPAEESSKPADADAPATEEAKPVVASTSTPVQAAA